MVTFFVACSACQHNCNRAQIGALAGQPSGEEMSREIECGELRAPLPVHTADIAKHLFGELSSRVHRGSFARGNYVNASISFAVNIFDKERVIALFVVNHFIDQLLG